MDWEIQKSDSFEKGEGQNGNSERAKRRVLKLLLRPDRAGFKPRPQGIDFVNKVCHILRPKPFSLRSILGLGDFHNVLAPDFPSDHNNQESKLFPTLREPIHESFPNGLEHIPAAVDDNDGPVPGQ